MCYQEKDSELLSVEFGIVGNSLNKLIKLSFFRVNEVKVVSNNGIFFLLFVKFLLYLDIKLLLMFFVKVGQLIIIKEILLRIVKDF